MQRLLRRRLQIASNPSDQKIPVVLSPGAKSWQYKRWHIEPMNLNQKSIISKIASAPPIKLTSLLFWASAFALMYAISRHNYNLFHSLADGISIVIAVSVFSITWNARDMLDNDYYLFIGVSFLFFGLMDLLHILGNKGMGVLPQYGNLGPAFYIASRYLLSLSLLAAPLFIHRKLKTGIMFAGYGGASAFLILSILDWQIFPACIVESEGLTPFKIVSDYAVCLILAAAIGHHFLRRRAFDKRVFYLIAAAIVLFIVTGLTFTLYTDPFGVTNAAGHFFQIASFYAVYLAFVETGIKKPQQTLYRRLKLNEKTLADHLLKLNEVNEELKMEIEERKQAQEAMNKSEARYRLLTGTASRLLNASHPQAIVEDLCRGVMDYLDCQVFFNFLVDGHSGRLRLNAYAGIPEDKARNIEWLDYGVAVCGCVAQGGERIIAENIFDIADVRTDIVKSFGVQAYCCHPLMAHDRLLGTLSFGTKTRPRFEPDEIELMRVVADQVAIAMGRRQTEDFLKQRTRQAEEANKELESFSYSVSHDLRAPLRAIDGYSRMLLKDLDGTLEAEPKRKLNSIRQNSAVMGRLIDDLLSLSRLGRQALKTSTLDMEKLFSDSWAELNQMTSRRNVEFKMGPLNSACGDPALIKQVVLNLLSNALKYSRRKDGPVIEVSSCNSDGSVVYRVKDNGAGFDMKYADKLFGVFQRLHTESEFEGTGVGLAIVQRIIHRHGGHVWAEGEVDKGATFYFSLPADKS